MKLRGSRSAGILRGTRRVTLCCARVSYDEFQAHEDRLARQLHDFALLPTNVLNGRCVLYELLLLRCTDNRIHKHTCKVFNGSIGHRNLFFVHRRIASLYARGRNPHHPLKTSDTRRTARPTALTPVSTLAMTSRRQRPSGGQLLQRAPGPAELKMGDCCVLQHAHRSGVLASPKGLAQLDVCYRSHVYLQHPAAHQYRQYQQSTTNTATSCHSPVSRGCYLHMQHTCAGRRRAEEPPPADEGRRKPLR